jgi:uncharacterized protein (DUF1697 family)
MPRFVAFLRAINVGGAHTVTMAALCRAFEAMDFTEVSSYIASGNIIFTAPSRSARSLEDRIEEGLMATIGFEITPFVRSIRDVARIAAFKPFAAMKIGATDQLGILFLPGPLPAAAAGKLLALKSATDEFHVTGSEIYWLRHRGPGGEVYSSAPFDKVLGVPFTVRSASTVKKIAEKYHSND